MLEPWHLFVSSISAASIGAVLGGFVALLVNRSLEAGRRRGAAIDRLLELLDAIASDADLYWLATDDGNSGTSIPVALHQLTRVIGSLHAKRALQDFGKINRTLLDLRREATGGAFQVAGRAPEPKRASRVTHLVAELKIALIVEAL